MAKRQRRRITRPRQAASKPNKKAAAKKNTKIILRATKKAAKKTRAKVRATASAAKSKARAASKKTKALIKKSSTTRPTKGVVKVLRDIFGRFKRSRLKPKARKAAPKKSRGRKVVIAKRRAPKKKVAAKKRRYKGPAPKVTVKPLPSGTITTISFDVPFKNLEQWLRDLETNPDLDGLIPKNAMLGFRFFGSNSKKLFKSVKDALFVLQAYETTIAANEGDQEKQLEIYRNIEFTLVESSASWNDYKNMFVEEKRRKRARYTKLAKAFKGTYWDRLKQRDPARYQAQLARKRAKASARYQRLKNSPEYKARQRAAAKRYYKRIK